MPIFATASKEVSVYYGTLHRRESYISLLSLKNFPSLKLLKQSKEPHIHPSRLETIVFKGVSGREV